MPVEFVYDKPETLKIGARFIAMNASGVVFYCQVKNSDCTEAVVLNAKGLGVRIVEGKKAVRIPYRTGASLPIRYIGMPEISDPNDFDAAVAWAKEKFGDSSQSVHRGPKAPGVHVEEQPERSALKPWPYGTRGRP